MPDEIRAVEVNRAPVLALWIAIVAQHEGYDWEASLTIGKVFAGLNAQDKGRRLGIFSAPKEARKLGLGEEFWIRIGGRGIPMKRLDEGLRAVVKEKPVDPKSVETYLEKSFGGSLSSVRDAMEQLASSRAPEDLDETAFGLYERFRPKVASGQRGWGQKGTLDLGVIRKLAENP
jgi:hypothetical protein